MGSYVTSKQYLIGLLIIVLTATFPAFAMIVPVSDIPMQTVQGNRASPPYAWTYAFDIGFSNLELNVEMQIGLTGADPGPILGLVWENGIENMWEHQYDIIDGDFRYHVNFDAILSIDPFDSVHHTVTVIEGQSSATSNGT